MMKRKLLWILLAAIFLLSAAPAFAQDLKLIPEPKQVERRAGAFSITSKTRIVINPAHTEEDHTAAETLAEEIERATGRKVAIVTSRSLPKMGVIYLARVGDDAKLGAALAASRLAVDEKLNDEGYIIDATTERVAIAARTGAGVFYGAQTLRQLLGQGNGAPAGESHSLSCPAVAIKDWPQMRWRGVHDDISRGPVPTLEYMKRQVRTCAAFKLNLFSLYLEHVFDYQSQPLVAPKEGAITAADVKELVAYARRYYVTILPEQQAFGHLHHVLKYETYSDMAETPHGHVLAPVNDKTYAFIKDLYAELVPLFPGPLFHIGADETFELGRGQTKAQADQVGLGRVYLEHLKRVAEIMKPYNKRLMFWGDIAMKYPELLGILPKDVIAVAWNYSPSPGFDNLLKPYKDAHLDLFVAPGASNWNRIFPNLDAAFLNIRNFVRDGQSYGALGMLNTTWDDDGEALFQMTWPAVVFGAACAWQPGESSIERFKANYDWAFYRNEDHVFRDALQSLARVHSILRDAKLGDANDEPFWSDPFTEVGAEYVEKAEAAAHDLRIEAERALALLYRHRSQARINEDTLDSLIFAGLRLDALGMKAQLVGEMNKYYWDAYLHMGDRTVVQRDLSQITGANGRLEDLRDATTRLREMYAKLWMAENRAYWLAHVTVRHDKLARLFQAKAQAVRQAMQQYRAQGTLPTPPQMGFYIK